MGHRHVVESLIEVNKNISQITDKMQAQDDSKGDQQGWINQLNDVISQLDHIVEKLSKR